MGEDEAVIFLYDDTFWGSARDGFLLTTKRLYAKNSSEKGVVRSIREIDRMTFLQEESEILVHATSGTFKIEVTLKPEVFNVLKETVELLKPLPLSAAEAAEPVPYAVESTRPPVRKRPKKKSNRAIEIILGLAALAALIFIGTLSHDEPVVIGEDGISIYLHQGYIWSRWTGGYEVRFDDIANIELSPHSAWQLGQVTDNLSVPQARPLGRGTRGMPVITTAAYDTGGNHRLHISLFPDAFYTIWITRYEDVPVLLSFRYGIYTQALYEQLVAAWRESTG